jgi:hypothetical protein
MPSACQPGLAFDEPDDGLQRVPSNCVAPELNIGLRKTGSSTFADDRGELCRAAMALERHACSRTAFDWLGNFDSIAMNAKAFFAVLWQRPHVVDAAPVLVLPRHRGLSGYAGGCEWASAITK